MPGRKLGSITPLTSGEARFITRRLSTLRLASNGPGAKLPRLLDGFDNVKRESALFKRSLVIHTGSV